MSKSVRTVVLPETYHHTFNDETTFLTFHNLQRNIGRYANILAAVSDSRG